MGPRNVKKKLLIGFTALTALAAFSVSPVVADAATGGQAPAQTAAAGAHAGHLSCASNMSWCTEVEDSETLFGDGHYVGHDEPSVLFYSDKAGAGNDNTYTLRLPKDPKAQPKQDGSGSTWNFQLHPAFWFGMAMCDDQSAPGPASGNAACKPDSDRNIYNSGDPSSSRYVGKHPGAAFMEMQFYPPGWAPWPAGSSCDPTKWCAALNIDSLSRDYNKGINNNSACLNSAGLEYVNFAFLTNSGQATTPADPTNNNRFNLDPAHDYFMKSGDILKVHMFDTRAGFKVDVYDESSHTHGAMTASVANGFAQVKFDPTATSCATIPSAFHPMYSTSDENTRVPWAAHSYNTAYSDETGHFEYCAAGDPATGNCTKAAGSATLDADDNGCFNPSDSLLVQIGGCAGNSPTDDDYNGVPYQQTWPGTGNPSVDRATKPQPIIFSSPTFRGGQQFSRVAFETDLPRIEDNGTLANPCNRVTGANCVNPPPGAQFYPMFTTTRLDGSCVWQEGGANIPGTTRKFGGTSQAEFGALNQLAYPGVGGPHFFYNDFRSVLSYNPCQARN